MSAFYFLSGSDWNLHYLKSKVLHMIYIFFYLLLLPAFLLLVLQLYFRADLLPMIGARQPSGTTTDHYQLLRIQHGKI